MSFTGETTQPLLTRNGRLHRAVVRDPGSNLGGLFQQRAHLLRAPEDRAPRGRATRASLSDPSADNRERLIDRLLDSPACREPFRRPGVNSTKVRAGRQGVRPPNGVSGGVAVWRPDPQTRGITLATPPE
jgi:hypothetical protein